MGKRALPPGLKCVTRGICAPPRYWDRWRRRAEQLRSRYGEANLSSAIRADADAAQRLRHDLRQPLNALKQMAEALSQGIVRPGEAAARIHTFVREVTELLKEEPVPVPPVVAAAGAAAPSCAPDAPR